MSADHSGKTKGGKSVLNALLDFGPETSAPAPTPSHDVVDRIKQIVKKLQEINQRIDDLSHRF